MPRRHPRLRRALGEVRPVLAAGASGGASGGPSGGASADEGWIRGQRVLIACSGGPDSLALLGLLERLAPALEITLAVAHVDHGIRPSAAAEGAQVLALAAARGLAGHLRRLTLAPGPGLPARAREGRRRALIEMAEESGASLIALGHTATDQAETVLMHIGRGAGLDGGAAMPADDLAWIRPLLGLTRAECGELCSLLELAPIDDPTNHDRRHLRVQIREELLPILRARNPALERGIAALARQAADAEAALEGWAAREEASRRLAPEGERLRWQTDGLAELPRAIRTRVLRRVIFAGGGDRQALGERTLASIDRALIARAREVEAGEHGPARGPHSWDLRPRLRLGLGRSGLWLAPAPDSGPDNH
ncbi:MAG: tRNA lysidine(34) synthetase TilS [Myxococcales bacterium]|nr:tRNA lysidine(34) synthetase TilS [Myxococcales bacterium]